MPTAEEIKAQQEIDDAGELELADRFERGKNDELESKLRKKVEKIEELSVGDFAKAELLLIETSLKPATEIDVFENFGDVNDLIDKLHDLGFIVRDKGVASYKNQNLQTVLAIAKDEKTIELLLVAEANQNHSEYGKLMGYPDTAIQAFGEKFTDENEKQLLKEYLENNKIVMQFSPSQENWREEVKIMKKWNDMVKEYMPNVYKELANQFDRGEDLMFRDISEQFLREYLSLNGENFDRIEKLNYKDLGGVYKKQYESFEDERMDNITVAVVPDDLWMKSQPTESNALNHVILMKESYYNKKESTDEIAWLTHELAHYQFLIDLDDVDKYEQDMQELAFDDIGSEYTYPNNIVEKVAFEKQFQYLKKEGKTRDDVMLLVMQYYEIDDMNFFNKILDKVYSD